MNEQRPLNEFLRLAISLRVSRFSPLRQLENFCEAFDEAKAGEGLLEMRERERERGRERKKVENVQGNDKKVESLCTFVWGR